MSTLRSRRSTPNSSLKLKSPPERVKSAFGQDKDHCLCVVFRPIITLGQLSGTLPVSRHAGSCALSHSWTSVPMLINLAWAFGNLFAAAMWAPTYYRYMRRSLGGTDFYTHLIANSVQLISSILLFFAGSVTGIYVAKAWLKLHDIVNEMGLHNFRYLKYLVYTLPLYLVQEISLNVILLFGELCYDDFRMDPHKLELRFSNFFVNFMPNLSTMTFALLITVAQRNFAGINDQLTELQDKYFNRFQESPARVSDEENAEIVFKLAKLRILHENLCDVVRKLETGFGCQLHAIFAATCVSFIVGVYSVIAEVNDIWDESDDKLEFFIKVSSSGLMPILAASRILVIVLRGQFLINSGNEAGSILTGFNLVNASDEVKVQVRKFLDKMGMFPVTLTAHGIIELGASFIGPAVGNVVTYTLVMMQFRLDDDPDTRVIVPVENGTNLFDFMKHSRN